MAWRFRFAGVFEEGDDISFTPLQLANVDAVRYRVASAGAGGTSDATSVHIDVRAPISGNTNLDYVVNLVDLNNVRKNFGGVGPAALAVDPRVSSRRLAPSTRTVSLEHRAEHVAYDLHFWTPPRKKRGPELALCGRSWDAGLLD